jgi:hypothetical protein
MLANNSLDAVIGQHAMFRARFSTSSDGTWQQKTAAVGSLQITTTSDANSHALVEASGALERVRALEVEPLDRREGLVVTLHDILQSRSLKELAQTASSKAPVSQREEKSPPVRTG